MLDHEQVWRAIDELAGKHGLSPSALARRSGLDPTTFNKSKRYAADGRPRWPSTESIAKVLRATKSSIGDLFPTDSPAPRPATASVPVLGTAFAGFHEGAAPPIPNDIPRPEIIPFPDPLYEPLYALTVVGDSMTPLYRNGDVLFITTAVEPEPGDRVAVKLSIGEILAKVYMGRSDNEYVFRAVSPDHPDASLRADVVDWVARIVYATQ